MKLVSEPFVSYRFRYQVSYTSFERQIKCISNLESALSVTVYRITVQILIQLLKKNRTREDKRRIFGELIKAMLVWLGGYICFYLSIFLCFVVTLRSRFHYYFHYYSIANNNGNNKIILKINKYISIININNQYIINQYHACGLSSFIALLISFV